MRFAGFRKIVLISAAIFAFFGFFSISQAEETEGPLLQETVTKYREILQYETDPAKIAEAHYEIGYALEKLGRETEATAEYLKIIVTYPQIEDVSKKAETRLARLYSGFSARSKEIIGRFDETAGQKDPTIFFAYIKSLYENYRNLGQYEKAISILKKLYDMDSENPSYLIEMGEVYLYGYGDSDKAIFHFTKAIEASPDNPKAYADLGRAFEKKDDYENAVKAYSKAVEIAPASPGAVFALRRIEGIRLAREKRLVKDWYFLGPFDNSDGKGLEKNFPPDEKIDLKAAYAGKDSLSIKWSRPFDYDSSGYVDLNALFKPNDYALVYALTYVYSPNKKEVRLKVGAEDGIKLWLNDRVILSYEITKSAEVDSDSVSANLQKGWNKILLKVSETWGGWGFYFRITDLGGNPLEDLIFDPIRDDARVKYIYGKYVREQRFKVTKIAAIYTVAISVLLLGLYFMILNIQNRIKINRMKEDFISSVSHELKTPISAVKMLTETLKRGKVKEDGRINEYYDMIIRESDRLTRFINKILDFSKIEKGGKIFYFERTNMAELAKATVGIFKDEIRDEALKIEFSAQNENIFADIDKDAISQVIFNLIDNAYKYSKEVKDIRVTLREEGENVYLEVTDKGLGIPKENIEKIFEKFYRIERDIIEGTKGSGLGLAFVKSVIHEHGGRIAVESEPGKGSKFIISLPIHKA